MNDTLLTKDQARAKFLDYIGSPDYLKHSEPSIDGTIRDAIIYMNSGPQGKLIRPIFTILTAQAYNFPVDHSLLALADAVRWGHNGSLGVDDAQDGDDVRRDKPSIPKKYGSLAAILLGIDIVPEALKLADDPCISDEVYRNIVRVMTSTIPQLVAGQYKDSVYKDQESSKMPNEYASNEARILDICDSKTGAFFDFAIRGGAAFAEAPSEDMQRWQGVAMGAGRMLQIGDDFSDGYATQREMGKATGKDGEGHNAVNLLGVSRAAELRSDARELVMTHLDWFSRERSLKVQPLVELTEELYDVYQEYVERGLGIA